MGIESPNEEGAIALMAGPEEITSLTPQLSYEPEDSIFSCHLPSLELAFMSIRSSEHRNPSSHNYDLTSPPYNYNEAMRRPDRDIWQATIDKELDMFVSMKIFREEVLPPGRSAIGSTWVFEFKIVNPPPNIAKGRLCARGYSQIPHIDFTETFAPVVKTTSVRIVAALAAKLDLHLECFDATRAFLWSDLNETIYMKYPQGYNGTAGMVWRLLKSLYGLKQASLMWYKLFKATLERLGFTRSEFDHGLFIYRREFGGSETVCFLAVHVDDGLGATNSAPFFTHLKSEIAKAFGIKDLGPVKSFIGFQFERDRATRELWIHQENYIDNLLDEYSLHDCNSVTTPLDSHYPFGNIDSTYPETPNLLKSYQHIISSLLFLSICTRPDITFAVMALSQWNSKPEPRHFASAKRVLRYLKGTKHLRLKYGGEKANLDLQGFTDSDWGANPSTRASVSGYCWFFAGAPISWSAKKQVCIALSTTEAEYVAMTRAFQEGIWLKNNLSQLFIPTSLPIFIKSDNEGAIALAANGISHNRTKHIDIRYHFIRSHVDSKEFFLSHIPGTENPADIFTKPLPCPLFEFHRTNLVLLTC